MSCSLLLYYDRYVLEFVFSLLARSAKLQSLSAPDAALLARSPPSLTTLTTLPAILVGFGEEYVPQQLFALSAPALCSILLHHHS